MRKNKNVINISTEMWSYDHPELLLLLCQAVPLIVRLYADDTTNDWAERSGKTMLYPKRQSPIITQPH